MSETLYLAGNILYIRFFYNLNEMLKTAILGKKKVRYLKKRNAEALPSLKKGVGCKKRSIKT